VPGAALNPDPYQCSYTRQQGVQRQRQKRDTIIKRRREVGDHRRPAKPARLAIVPPGRLLGGVERA
jgi:hypothetical protein